MWSPGADNLSGHRDHQTQVRPQVGLATASQHSRGRAGRLGWARAAGAAGAVSPALSPHRSHPALGRDAAAPSQGAQEGQQSQEDKSASAGESPQNHAHGRRPTPRLGQAEGPGFQPHASPPPADRLSRCFSFPFPGSVFLPSASTLHGSGTPRVSFTVGNTLAPLKVSAQPHFPCSISLV